MSTMPSVGSGTYSPGPNMVCSPEQEKVGTGSIEAIIYPVYSDLRIRVTVSKNSVSFLYVNTSNQILVITSREVKASLTCLDASRSAVRMLSHGT